MLSLEFRSLEFRVYGFLLGVTCYLLLLTENSKLKTVNLKKTLTKKLNK